MTIERIAVTTIVEDAATIIIKTETITPAAVDVPAEEEGEEEIDETATTTAAVEEEEATEGAAENQLPLIGCRPIEATAMIAMLVGTTATVEDIVMVVLMIPTGTTTILPVVAVAGEDVVAASRVTDVIGITWKKILCELHRAAEEAGAVVVDDIMTVLAELAAVTGRTSECAWMTVDNKVDSHKREAIRKTTTTTMSPTIIMEEDTLITIMLLRIIIEEVAAFVVEAAVVEEAAFRVVAEDVVAKDMHPPRNTGAKVPPRNTVVARLLAAPKGPRRKLLRTIPHQWCKRALDIVTPMVPEAFVGEAEASVEDEEGFRPMET